MSEGRCPDLAKYSAKLIVTNVFSTANGDIPSDMFVSTTNSALLEMTFREGQSNGFSTKNDNRVEGRNAMDCIGLGLGQDYLDCGACLHWGNSR